MVPGLTLDEKHKINKHQTKSSSYKSYNGKISKTSKKLLDMEAFVFFDECDK